jgi:hypothetical protein
MYGGNMKRNDSLIWIDRLFTHTNISDIRALNTNKIEEHEMQFYNEQ